MKISALKELWHSRNLLANLVRRDLTVRYKSTVLGFFWSFLKPLAYVAIYHFIFGYILPVTLQEDRIPYSVHILAALLPWTFFVAATSEAMGSIIGSANLVKKVRLPLEVFPLAAVCSQAVHFILSMVVVVAAMLWFDLIPSPMFLLLPLAFMIQFVLVLAFALFLSSLNVFYRDVSSVWEVVGAALFYATPIIYPVDQALAFFTKKGWTWAQWLYLANPMTPIVLAYRRFTLYAALDAPIKEISDELLMLSFGLASVVSLLFLIFAHSVFQRLSRRFADEL